MAILFYGRFFSKMDSAWLCNYIHPIVLLAVDKIGKTLITPEVGMTFQSEDKAYEITTHMPARLDLSLEKVI